HLRSVVRSSCSLIDSSIAVCHTLSLHDALPIWLSPFLLAMVAILWAYDGWGDLAFVGGEVKDPERNLPRAMFIGTGSVVALYLVANLVYLYLIPVQQMKSAELVAADVARLLLGPAGLVAVSAAVAVSPFRSLNGCMMAA